MIPAYRALDAAYSKTHGRCCCTYRHGPWECPFVCQLCSKRAHEPWFMRAVHKPRFILAFRISRTTGTADHGVCTRFGFVNHDLCLFQRALLSSDRRLAWGLIWILIVPQWLRYHPDGRGTPFNLSSFPPHCSEYPNYATRQAALRVAAVVFRGT